MTRIAEEAWRVRIMKQERIRSKRRRFRVFRRKLRIRLQRKICSWLENEGPQRFKQDDRRSKGGRGRNRIRISIRKHDHGSNIDLLPDGGAVLEGGEEDARSGNDYDR